MILVFSYAFDLGIFGAIIGFLVLGVYATITYFAGDAIILALSRAKPLTNEEFPFVFNVVEGLAIASGIPVPKIYIMEDPALNAFATGRNPSKSAVVLTRGILTALNKEELEGVLAHEISHIANNDVQFSMVAVVFAGSIALLSDMLWRSMRFSGGGSRKGNPFMLIAIVFAIIAPFFAELVRFALSREREYLADANGAKLTRYPEGLAKALEKLANNNLPVQNATKTTASLYFAEPLRGGFGSLFSTHPPIQERIKRLRAM